MTKMCAKDPMQDFVAEVVVSVRQYCRGQTDRCMQDRLARLAASMAQQRLRGRLAAASKKEQATVEQIALSIVAPLFREDVANSPLTHALKDVLAADDATLFSRFQTVVVRSAAQEMFHWWGESDPLSARLWRTLQRTLRHDPRIVVFPVDSPTMAVLATERDLRDSMPFLEHREIVRIIGETSGEKKSVAEIIVDVLTYAAQAPNRRKFLRAEDLFEALRESLTQFAGAELAERTTRRLDDPDLQLAIEKARKVTRQKVGMTLNRYQTHGKLNTQQVEYFHNALNDLLIDCADGGPAQSYFQYFHPYWPDLSIDMYRNKFRARFEYLADVTQQIFFAEIKKELFHESQQKDLDATSINQEERGES